MNLTQRKTALDNALQIHIAKAATKDMGISFSFEDLSLVSKLIDLVMYKVDLLKGDCSEDMCHVMGGDLKFNNYGRTMTPVRFAERYLIHLYMEHKNVISAMADHVENELDK